MYSSGINQLIPLSKVSIKQKTTYFTANKYVVMSGDDVILYAKEDGSTLGFFFGGNSRAFNIDVFDTQHQEAFRLRRPYTFGPDKMEVTVQGQRVSVVRQEATFFKPVLNINGANDEPVFRVKGPISKTGEADFDIFTPTKKRVGVIRKEWRGIGAEWFTDSDNFTIHFPVDLDMRFKAAIIGTCFLIDFLYYEN